MPSATDATSARIGDKLLAGWTLLAENCPRPGCATPLLRSRAAGAPLYCPQHDGGVDAAELDAVADAAAAKRPSYDDDAHADERLGPYARPPMQPAAPRDVPPAPFGEAAASTHTAAAPVVDQSAAIAELLLAGWTMLGEACPLPGCHAPLMCKKADRKKFCPVHRLWVLTEEEARAAAAEKSAAVSVVAAPSAPAPAPVAGVNTETAAAIATLRRTIAEAAETLEGQRDVRLATSLVALITQCANAITALRACDA